MAGNLDAWAQGNIFAPLAYAGMADLAPGLRRGVLDAVPPFSALLLACAGLWFPDAGARRAALLVLPWLAAALLAVVAPWKFYDHYFLILLPPLSLLGAFGLSALVRHVVQPALVRRAFAVLVALVVLTPAAAMMLPRLSHGIGLRAGDPIRAIAREATLALGPGDTMYVANWHTLPYALARQAPPTRYAFPIHLSGYEPGLIGVDADAELARVLALPPGAIIVAVDVTGVAAVVRGGRLVRLQGGQCDGALSLYAEHQRLAERRHKWEPSLLVSLDPPVNLVPEPV